MLLIFAGGFSTIIAIICLLTVDSILVGLGATPEILPFAKQYAIPFLIGFPLRIIGQTAYSFTRLAEKPFAASLTYIVPSVVGAVFEYFANELHDRLTTVKNFVYNTL